MYKVVETHHLMVISYGGIRQHIMEINFLQKLLNGIFGFVVESRWDKFLVYHADEMKCFRH